MYIQIKCMYIISLPPIRKTKDNHKMRRIKSIEPILCNITMYESSCSIIQVEYHTRKQSSSYAVMHHERSGRYAQCDVHLGFGRSGFGCF